MHQYMKIEKEKLQQNQHIVRQPNAQTQPK